MKPQFSCCFVLWREQVLLVRKQHPEWQAGRLNGVGGRAQPGETPLETARREFKEETGINTDFSEFCVLEDNEAIVHFFRAFLPPEVNLTEVLPETNDRGEALVLSPLHGSVWSFPGLAIDNLCWLIPMAFMDDYHAKAKVSAYCRRKSDDGSWIPDGSSYPFTSELPR